MSCVELKRTEKTFTQQSIAAHSNKARSPDYCAWRSLITAGALIEGKMKVAFVAPHPTHVNLFWRGLAERLINCGWTVHLYSADDDAASELRQIGVICKEIPVNRFIAPVTDLRMLWRLYWAFRKENYDVVHNFTIKANVFSAMAARAAGCPRIINTVLGLGYAFSSPHTARGALLRMAASRLYRAGFGACTKAVLINRDDLEEVTSHGLVPEAKTVLVRGGAGVDLERNSSAAIGLKELSELRQELKIPTGSPVVLMASRLFWSKGVRQFCEAARELKHEFPNASFVLAGPLDTGSPEAVPEAYLNESKSYIRWVGMRRDIRPVMALCDVFVLPSYYREGLPQVLLEAAAFGKPIVTTDNVGCRDTVKDGWNGFLVAPRDIPALVESVGTLLRDARLRRRFGENSRRKAEQEYDKRLVLDQIVRDLYAVPNQTEILGAADSTSGAVPTVHTASWGQARQPDVRRP